MNNEQKYLVFIKSAFSSETRKVDYDKATDTHRPMTLRDYIDRSFKHLLHVMLVTVENCVAYNRQLRGVDSTQRYSTTSKIQLPTRLYKTWELVQYLFPFYRRGSLHVYYCFTFRNTSAIAVRCCARTKQVVKRGLRIHRCCPCARVSLV
ncbi:MAG: hypothetical protein LBU65_06840 [Planctomycetaceae bacterium]|nr:hypothetical protein [Planctomycetaceae bacterium]